MSTEFFGTGVPPLTAKRALCVLAAATCRPALPSRCVRALPASIQPVFSTGWATRHVHVPSETAESVRHIEKLVDVQRYLHWVQNKREA